MPRDIRTEFNRSSGIGEELMDIIDYKNSAIAEMNRVAAEGKEAKNAAVWREAITKYAFASHDANRKILLDWCSGELSMTKIDWLMQRKPDGLTLDWADEKPKLTEAILAARQYPNLEQERKRLTLLTRVQLIDQLAHMVTKEELSKFTAAELKQGLAEVRKSNIPRYAGYENLPRTIVPKGFVSAVDTAEFLRHVARTDLRTLQYYVKRYGSQQVNDFLNDRI
jgi:hypothetical protein